MKNFCWIASIVVSLCILETGFSATYDNPLFPGAAMYDNPRRQTVYAPSSELSSATTVYELASTSPSPAQRKITRRHKDDYDQALSHENYAPTSGFSFVYNPAAIHLPPSGETGDEDPHMYETIFPGAHPRVDSFGFGIPRPSETTLVEEPIYNDAERPPSSSSSEGDWGPDYCTSSALRKSKEWSSNYAGGHNTAGNLSSPENLYYLTPVSTLDSLVPSTQDLLNLEQKKLRGAIIDRAFSGPSYGLMGFLGGAKRAVVFEVCLALPALIACELIRGHSASDIFTGKNIDANFPGQQAIAGMAILLPLVAGMVEAHRFNQLGADPNKSIETILNRLEEPQTLKSNILQGLFGSTFRGFEQLLCDPRVKQDTALRALQEVYNFSKENNAFKWMGAVHSLYIRANGFSSPDSDDTDDMTRRRTALKYLREVLTDSQGYPFAEAYVLDLLGRLGDTNKKLRTSSMLYTTLRFSAGLFALEGAVNGVLRGLFIPSSEPSTFNPLGDSAVAPSPSPHPTSTLQATLSSSSSFASDRSSAAPPRATTSVLTSSAAPSLPTNRASPTVFPSPSAIDSSSAPLPTPTPSSSGGSTETIFAASSDSNIASPSPTVSPSPSAIDSSSAPLLPTPTPTLSSSGGSPASSTDIIFAASSSSNIASPSPTVFPSSSAIDSSSAQLPTPTPTLSSSGGSPASSTDIIFAASSSSNIASPSPTASPSPSAIDSSSAPLPTPTPSSSGDSPVSSTETIFAASSSSNIASPSPTVSPSPSAIDSSSAPLPTSTPTLSSTETPFFSSPASSPSTFAPSTGSGSSISSMVPTPSASASFLLSSSSMGVSASASASASPTPTPVSNSTAAPTTTLTTTVTSASSNVTTTFRRTFPTFRRRDLGNFPLTTPSRLEEEPSFATSGVADHTPFWVASGTALYRFLFRQPSLPHSPLSWDDLRPLKESTNVTIFDSDSPYASRFYKGPYNACASGTPSYTGHHNSCVAFHEKALPAQGLISQVGNAPISIIFLIWSIKQVWDNVWETILPEPDFDYYEGIPATLEDIKSLRQTIRETHHRLWPLKDPWFYADILESIEKILSRTLKNDGKISTAKINDLKADLVALRTDLDLESYVAFSKLSLPQKDILQLKHTLYGIDDAFQDLVHRETLESWLADHTRRRLTHFQKQLETLEKYPTKKLYLELTEELGSFSKTLQERTNIEYPSTPTHTLYLNWIKEMKHSLREIRHETKLKRKQIKHEKIRQAQENLINFHHLPFYPELS